MNLRTNITGFNLRQMRKHRYVLLVPLGQRGLNTKRPTIVFFLGPTKSLPRTGDTVLVRRLGLSREMIGGTKILPCFAGGRRGKDDRKQNTLVLLLLSSPPTECNSESRGTILVRLLFLERWIENYERKLWYFFSIFFKVFLSFPGFLTNCEW